MPTRREEASAKPVSEPPIPATGISTTVEEEVTTATSDSNAQSDARGSNLKGLFAIGGVAALLQLTTILAMAIVMATLGQKPTSAEEYFTIQQGSRLASILRGDLLTLILIGLYLGTIPALYAALRPVSPVYAALAALFTLIAVTGAFATESTFSLLYLGDRYAAAAGPAERARFLAAGEAVIASDMWNSSAAYMGGLLLQGAGVMISVIMLRSRDFSRVTAYAGLLGNGFDLAQHTVHPFAPAVSTFIMAFMGLFYLVSVDPRFRV
jgi:hypothetical protein